MMKLTISFMLTKIIKNVSPPLRRHNFRLVKFIVEIRSLSLTCNNNNKKILGQIEPFPGNNTYICSVILTQGQKSNDKSY